MADDDLDEAEQEVARAIQPKKKGKKRKTNEGGWIGILRGRKNKAGEFRERPNSPSPRDYERLDASNRDSFADTFGEHYLLNDPNPYLIKGRGQRAPLPRPRPMAAGGMGMDVAEQMAARGIQGQMQGREVQGETPGKAALIERALASENPDDAIRELHDVGILDAMEADEMLQSHGFDPLER